MPQDWLFETAGHLGRGIRSGRIDPIDLTECYLDAIDSHDLKDRIFALTTRDRAIAEATAASRRAKTGHFLGPLDGVPISWKDLFDTAGTITEAGTALLKGRIPDADAEVLQTATNAGLVCLGKTHTSELAFSGLGLNPTTATPPCVNDLDAVSGGSSSGAATSVAFGLAAAGIGSDTGGSVRVPAAWNDLVGLKTTAGRVSLKGVVPLCKSFDTVGPLCRSVEDASLLLAAMENSKPSDLKDTNLTGARFLVPEGMALSDLDDKPAAAFEAALEKLAKAGAKIDHKPLKLIEEALPLSAILFTTEAYAQWQDEIEAAPHLMFDQILERFQAGLEFSGVETLRAWATIDRLRQEYAVATQSYDAVLVPSSSIMPPNHDRLLSDHDYYINANLLALRNTRIGNLFGLSGLTLPTSQPSCGLMVLAAPMAEERLLRIGHAMEKLGL